MLHADHTLIEIGGHVLIGSVFLSQSLSAMPRDRFRFHSGRLGDRRIPAPDFVLVCGLAMMLGGGTMVALDVFPSIGAALLLTFSIVATVLFQNFWAVEDPVARRGKRGSFFNNLAIIGGLLLVLVSA